MVKIGQAVTYVDTTGKERPALVTNVHGTTPTSAVNLVIVNDDEKQTDTYGQKIERFSSVVNQASQSAHGNYWRE